MNSTNSNQSIISKLLLLYKSGSHLKQKVAAGSIWLGIGTVAENAGRLIRNILLARLIVPDAFGLMAIVLSINTLFETFTEVGMKQAIVQNKNGSD